MISYMYEPPAPRGHSGTRAPGGWSFSGINQVQSGSHSPSGRTSTTRASGRKWKTSSGVRSGSTARLSEPHLRTRLYGSMAPPRGAGLRYFRRAAAQRITQSRVLGMEPLGAPETARREGPHFDLRWDAFNVLNAPRSARPTAIPPAVIRACDKQDGNRTMQLCCSTGSRNQ